MLCILCILISCQYRIVRSFLLLRAYQQFDEKDGWFCLFRLLYVQEWLSNIWQTIWLGINTFIGWKRLLLADGPRQTINGLTLYSFYLSQKDNGNFWDLNKYTGGSYVTGALIFSTLTTVIIFIGSALLLLAAGVCYIPLLCHIQGNLKVIQTYDAVN